MLKIWQTIILSFILRFVVMVIGFVMGWLLGALFAFMPFSDTLLKGMNLLVDTPRFSREHIATLMAILFFFGGFFIKTDLTED